jgi:hypothetical protein
VKERYGISLYLLMGKSEERGAEVTGFSSSRNLNLDFVLPGG